MNEYEVTYCYELVNVTTIVIADNVEQAARFAGINLIDAGIILATQENEITVTKTGEYAL